VGLLGDPAYYSRFGFRPGPSFGVNYDGALLHPDAFQLAELRKGALEGVTGVAREEAEFEATQ
jgi:predicted N-acetyltransferase YhbS